MRDSVTYLFMCVFCFGVCVEDIAVCIDDTGNHTRDSVTHFYLCVLCGVLCVCVLLCVWGVGLVSGDLQRDNPRSTVLAGGVRGQEIQHRPGIHAHHTHKIGEKVS